MKPIIYQNQRLLTTVQIADAYGADHGRIRKNHNENKSRFIEGKHFFKLTGDDLLQVRNSDVQIEISNKTRHLYLWTEKGAWMHAKSLNTDKAWEAYELLVDTYYSVMDAVQSPPIADDPATERVVRLLSFIRNNQDIIDTELSTVIQRRLARQLEGQAITTETPIALPAPATAEADPYIYTTDDIAVVAGVSRRMIALLSTRNKLRQPKYSIYKPLGGKPKNNHIKQIHYNDAGRTKLLALARKARR